MRRLLLPTGLFALALGLAVLVFGGAAPSAAPASATTPAVATLADAATPPADVNLGHVLFVQNCSSCHGVNLEGGALAPNLRGVGAETVDLWVSSGWMPLAVPTDQPIKKPAAFTPAETRDIAEYVESVGGGPDIPTVNLQGANESKGFELFSLNCAPCHTITGAGDALSNGITAPSLHGISPTEIAEAVATGPGNMPRLSPGALTKAQVDDVIEYVTHGIQHTNNAGGLALGGVGPVAEGFIGLFVGVGAGLIVALWIGDRNKRDEHEEETPAHV